MTGGMRIEYEAIGVIRSPHKELDGMPIQPSRARGVRGTVELDPRYEDGLKDLGGFSHVILLCHLHRARLHRLTVVPFLDTVERGLFATRSPSRPNPIGLSVVRLVAVDGPRLEVEDLDLLDGTPVLDVKPYVPEFDQQVEIRLGWLEEARRRSAESDGRFEQPATEQTE